MLQARQGNANELSSELSTELPTELGEGLAEPRQTLSFAEPQVHLAPKLNEIVPVQGVLGSTFDVMLAAAERAFAVCMLVATAPVMIAIALAIRLDSPGPVIFTQRRIARMDKASLPGHAVEPYAMFSQSLEELRSRVPTFTLYKFRTYHHRADRADPKRANFDFDPDHIGEVHLQLKDDPRITRVGRFLRRTSLDELPNFINICKGEMRLIGPRPEVQEMVRYYTLEQLEKFTVEPGITGLAQVNGRGKLNFKETLTYDLWYVRNRSLRVNLRILLKTIRVVLTGDGSF